MGWLSDLINKAKKKTQETVQGISQGVQNATQNVASGVQNAVQNVTSGYSDWLNGVQDNVSGAMEQGKNALGGIVENAGQVAGNVIDAATNGAQQVQQGIDYAKQAAGEAAANLAPKIEGAIATGQQTVENIGNQVYQKAQETGTNIYNQAVDKANEAKEAVGQFVDKAQDAAGQAITDATNRVNNFVNDTTQAVGNAVQNVSQGVTDKVNDINNKIQGNTTTQAPSVTEPVTQGSQAPTVTPSTTPSTTTPSPEQTPTNTQTQVTTSDSQTKEEPILSYEDYLKKESEGLGYIKDQTTQHIDQQNKDTLAHIDETLASGKKYAEDVKNTTDAALEAQKNADVDYAESQRDLMKDTSQAERNAVYKYAEETLTSALGYNQEAYGKLVEAITSQMEAGKLAASEAKNLLMIMAEEAKNTTYGAAERQRTEAERQADINRQRAITDANSAYEQNKAEYGAKAEALGNMGLSGGGYGDWLNASAYAQQRGEVQGARAQSDAAKREAKYTEDMTKLQADQEYSNKKYQAESEYQSKLHDIDTSYRANMSEAEQSKLAADKAAQDAEREAKRQADSKHSENVYNAESSYAAWVNKAESAEREGKLQSDIDYKGYLYESDREATDKKLQANQSAENDKLNAEISYVEGILGNSKALAEYKESLKAGDAAAEEKKLAVYEQLLRGVNDGTYTAEDAAALADVFGLGKEWKDSIAKSAGNKAEADADTESKIQSEIARDTYTKLLNSANVGAYNEAQISSLADEYGLTEEQKQSLVDAAKGYASQTSKAEGETKEVQQRKTYVDLLSGVYSGAYDKDLVSSLATEFGLSDSQKASLIKEAEKYASNVEAGKTQTDTEYKRGVYTELLDIANRGGYDADQIGSLADEYGLSEGQKASLVSAAKGYASRVGDEKAQAEAQTKLNIYTNLLDAANMGGYTSEQIKNLASKYGLDETQTEELKNAADAYATNNANAAAKDEAAQKNMQFINLLASANAGELTKAELANVAGAFGLDDAQKELLASAADRFSTASTEDKNLQKSINFVELLNSANSGAYTKDQVAEIAGLFGFDSTNADDKKLIDMLTGAADAYATGKITADNKANTEYQNNLFAEMLSIANQGGYTSDQLKDLGAAFGLSKDKVDALTTAANNYETNKTEAEEKAESDRTTGNKLSIKADITGDVTDEELDSYVDDGIITEEDASELKEYRNGQAAKELDMFVKGGDYYSAAEKADEFYERGVIDEDTYQKTYFEISVNDCNNVDSYHDFDDMEAELLNRKSAGQISGNDYKELTQYLYKNAGQSVNVFASTWKSGNNTRLQIKIGDASVEYWGYDYFKYPTASSSVSSVLDKIASANGNVNSVVLDGKLYCRLAINSSDIGWREVPVNEQFVLEYSRINGHKKKDDVPSHKTQSSKNSGNVGGIGNFQTAGGASNGKNILNTYK